jgi:hypothetical protein
MKNDRPNDELQMALTRMIEGEAEPQDDLLIAEHLGREPELRTLLRHQLQIDALLCLEAEPTAAGFEESVAAQTVSPAEDADAFLERVSTAMSMSGGGAGDGRSFGGTWLSWRPLTAAAAGLIFGMLCTSVVFGYIGAAPRRPIPILDAGFEDIAPPKPSGVPRKFGQWSGDFAEIVGPQNGVTPHGGEKMWRFLRADNETAERAQKNYVGEAIHVVDLKPLRAAGAKAGAQIEISACFAQAQAAPSFRYHWNIKAAAFEGSVAEASTLWGNWNEASASLAKREELAHPNGQWQRLSVTMQLPPSADFLVFECAVVQHQPAISEGVATFPAHYLDDVRVRLLPPAREQGPLE